MELNMKEFVYGSDRQYEMLKEMLEDHLCHVYRNCALPQSCSRPTARIGFEKEDSTYALYIDKGITCAKSSQPRNFRGWLSEGTLRFLEFTDMKEFLRSLKPLYEGERT